MKFIHAADIHLDSPLRDLVFQDVSQLKQLRCAARDTFGRMIDLAIERHVAFVILAGDLYDNDRPNMQTAAFLRNELIRLGKAGIRAVIVKGNHDADNRITGALALPESAVILRDDRPETIRYDDLSVPVAIHGQSFKPGPLKENLAAGYPPPLSGYLNIGVLHTSLAGNSEHAEYAPCSLGELTSRGYGYWALGHIHKADILWRDPWVVYPGNIQGRHAKETGPKGCVLVEADGDRIVSADPIALDGVRWQNLTVDLQIATEEAELIEAIRSSLAQAHRSADGRPTAVRLTLSGTTSLHPWIGKRPARLRQTVIELAGEVAGEKIWIEKIRDETAPPASNSTGTSSEAASELIRIMYEVAGDGPGIAPLLEQQLTMLRAKLPEEFKEHPALRILEDPGMARETLIRLEPRMSAILTGEDEDTD